MSGHTFRLTYFDIEPNPPIYYWVCACGSMGRKAHADPLGAQADWAHHVKVQQRKAARV